jgi:phage-related protein (TIGR01555 family)
MSATIHWLRDSLINFVTSYGTVKDSTVAAKWNLVLLNRNDVENAFRSDWIARRIVEAPAEDAVREWRAWQANQNQIEAIEELEEKLKIQSKVRQAIIRARLYGGAGLILGVDQGEASEPLDLDKVGKDDLKFVVVLNRYELMAGPRIHNVESPWYTQPEYFTVATPLFGFYGEEGSTYPGTKSNYKPGDTQRQVTPVSGMVQIHPSRVVQFYGNELPDWRLVPLGGLWGDSVLQTCEDVLKDFGMSVGGIANMINDAKLDVIKIPQLTQNLSNAASSNKLLTRFMVANQSKSVINSLLLDKEEEWERIQTSFGSLPEIMREFMTLLAGAAEMPMSRIFGQSPRGLGSGSGGAGEQDTKNYYDNISSKQKTVYTPAMKYLDEVLIRSALGKRDPNIHYDWAPLYLPDPKETAAVQKSKADTLQVHVNTGLFNEDALRKAAVNQIGEDKVYAGWEDAIEEFGEEPDVVEARIWSPGIDPRTGKPIAPGGSLPPPNGGKPPNGGGQPLKQITGKFKKQDLGDAAPRTLYVRRDVLNGDEIRAWAKQQGFKTTVPASDMHVTITFSRTPVDWMKVASNSWSSTVDKGGGELQTTPGGPRLIEKFGDAVVLLFANAELTWRHDEMVKAGCSWDFPEYQPHITISWNAEGLDLSRIEPYQGAIRLGPEIFEEVEEGWKEEITEDFNPNHDPKSGEFSSGNLSEAGKSASEKGGRWREALEQERRVNKLREVEAGRHSALYPGKSGYAGSPGGEGLGEGEKEVSQPKSFAERHDAMADNTAAWILENGKEYDFDSVKKMVSSAYKAGFSDDDWWKAIRKSIKLSSLPELKGPADWDKTHLSGDGLVLSDEAKAWLKGFNEQGSGIERIVDAIRAMPQPVINVHTPDVVVHQPEINVTTPDVKVTSPEVNVTVPITMPKKGVEVTTVTAHDSEGRIKEFERREIDDEEK